MKTSPLLLLSLSSTALGFDREKIFQQIENPQDPDLVVVSYHSYENPSQDSNPLFVRSIQENENKEHVSQVLIVGEGQHLWTHHENDRYEKTHGWMFRMRLTIEAVLNEYHKRDGKDFLALVADAQDVYIPQSSHRDVLEQLKDRFLTKFADNDLVFSSQIWCCNPSEFQPVARREWDEGYKNLGGVPSVYKHLNAGLYMGYASAILEMAKDMNIFDTSYKPPEFFNRLIQSRPVVSFHMRDLKVDDDEFQISTWYIDHVKNKLQFPRVALDTNQDLFTTTGTQRTQHRDGGFLTFSRNDFFSKIGNLPESMRKDDLDKVPQCPYEYNSETRTWTNTITDSTPLVFHFAGVDWLCACQIFEEEGYKAISPRFF